MQNSTPMPADKGAAYWALLLGTIGLLVGYGLIYFFPQQPDGDITALMQFEIQNGNHPFSSVHRAFWLNLAGALFAWGALGYFLRQVVLLLQPPFFCRMSGPAIRQWAVLLMWAGLLVMWSGWAWNQTRGWQGTLFLETGSETPLGVDKRPSVRFERFLLPPAPDGVGRALQLRLFVDHLPHDISEAHPYQGAGWTLKPHWYGLTVKSKALPQALFFGTSGSTQALLKDGRSVTVTVQTAPLSTTSSPPLPDLQVSYHAIVQARFAPGVPLQQIGLLIVLVGAVVILDFRFRRRRFRFRRRRAKQDFGF